MKKKKIIQDDNPSKVSDTEGDEEDKETAENKQKKDKDLVLSEHSYIG